MQNKWIWSICAGVVVVFATCSPAFANRAQSDLAAEKCAALTTLNPSQFPNPTTVITAAKWNAASAEQTNPGRGPQANAPALPQHCEVLGKINERVGANSQTYAIKFHMRLPADWNGRFFFQGGGGSDGNLGTALGNLAGQQPKVAVQLGYAVVTEDAGHDNAVNNDPHMNGTQTFGFDPQARLDYGYNSFDQVTQAAKALIRAYYGRMPEKSYFVGCSSGGREAITVSQRFPTYFDGILACSPAFRMPLAVIAELWSVQAFADAAKQAGLTDSNGQPFVNKVFSDEDLALVSNVILGACDALDGLTDGIIDNQAACTSSLVAPRLAAVTCKGEKTASCLLADQVTALEKAMSGPKNSKGKALYPDWPWDAGIGGKVGSTFSQGWRQQLIGPYNATANSGVFAGLGTGLLATIFLTPPVVLPASGSDLMTYALKFNFDTDTPKIYTTGGIYTESGWDLMMSNSTDLSPFKKHGSKLMIVGGMSDALFSFHDIATWWKEVDKINHGQASDFVRLFGVPGMNHVSGGPSTDQFDAFGALINWVEQGSPPDRIEAKARETTPWPGRTRPLCLYPKQSHYKGAGSIEVAGSFVCQ